MAKPSKLPSWDTTEVNSVEPDTTHQDEGWLAPGGIPEKPPFQTFNHWMNAVWKWIKEFNRQGIVEWDGTTVYEIDDVTKGSDGFLYTSLVGTNTNFDPTLEPTKWSPLVSKLSGFKNLLINGDKRVNQRNYADATLADGVYGYDRWKGADSDVNIEQIIEQQNIITGTYTISFDGGGTATVAGTSGLSSGDSVSITVASDISVKVPKASTNIQLEAGSIKTNFEQRNFGLELNLCQWYYRESTQRFEGAVAINSTTILARDVNVHFGAMRIAPTVTTAPNTGWVGTPSPGSITNQGFQISADADTATAGTNIVGYTADAEL